jgi:protocatechuate 3,4-dioxygenase, beta subunit
MIGRFARLLFIVPLLYVPVVSAQMGPPPTPAPPDGVSSAGIVAAQSEPGERLVISGQAMAPDGITPAAGVFIYAYQTDATGEYRNDSNRVARLHGWAKTDQSGRFEFRTIRPAPYPNRGIPAHVHFHAWGNGYPLQWTEDLKFAGDPLLSPRDISASQALGNFANIRPLTRDADGVWHCSISFRLSKQTNYPTQYRDDPRTR